MLPIGHRADAFRRGPPPRRTGHLLWETLARAEPANTVYISELANAYDLVSFLHDRGDRFAESLRDQERAFALRQAMVEAHPEDPSTHIALASTLNNLGALLHRTSLDVLVRLRIFRRSAEHSRIAYTRAPQDIRNGKWLTTGIAQHRRRRATARPSG